MGDKGKYDLLPVTPSPPLSGHFWPAPGLRHLLQFIQIANYIGVQTRRARYDPADYLPWQCDMTGCQPCAPKAEEQLDLSIVVLALILV